MLREGRRSEIEKGDDLTSEEDRGSYAHSVGRLAKRVRRAMPGPIASALGDERAQMRAQMTRRFRDTEVSKPKGPILFWVPGGMPLMLHVEGVIAAALKLRGVDVHAIICDGPFDACIRREALQGVPIERWHELCASCRQQTSSVLDDLAVPYSFIGDYLNKGTSRELRTRSLSATWDRLEALEHEGTQLGENVRSAILRYFQGVGFNGDERIVREYSFSALSVAAASKIAIETIRPKKIFMSHANYADWGPALRVASEARIPVVGWVASYLPVRFYFRHLEEGSIDFHSMGDLAWERRRKQELSHPQSARLDRFLTDRYRSSVSFDMREFKSYRGDPEVVRKNYGLKHDKPVWTVFCHINWDQVADYSPMLHETFDDWVLDTVRTVSRIKDVQWLIKVHPAEKWDNSFSGTEALLEEHLSRLPDHVHLVRADDDVSPMDLYDVSDGGVTVYGTPGLELSLMGRPVILAGEAHYGGRGFTYDPVSLDDYRALLARVAAIKPLDQDQIVVARRYAYSYFIQRQIPLPPVRDPLSKWWAIQKDRLDDLLPGRDPFVDLICDRILDGKDFELSEELIERAKPVTSP